MNQPIRQAILILGMHRSGTSALAGAAHLLGAAAPVGMMQAASDNPTGFWESLPVSALNEALFTAQGCAWYDALTFDPARFTAEEISELAPHCLSVLAQEFGEAPLFVLKDPRLSLLFPLWAPMLDVAGYRVAPVLALRHPAEVAASLKRRDNMPHEIAAPLWLHYALESERATRSRARAIVSYDRTLRSSQDVMERIATACGIRWPISQTQAGPQISAFLQLHMRHHHAAPGRVGMGRHPLAAWIAEVYDALSRLEQSGEDPAQHKRLDHVRTEFANWRSRAPRVSLAAAGGQEPLTIKTTPQTTSTNPATSPGRNVSLR